MKRSELIFILKSFLVWRVGLFVLLFLAIKFVPLQLNFLGGGLGNYLKNPYLWAWVNFDGEHYLSIAQSGYGFGERAFFPLLPLLIKYVGGIIDGSLLSYNIAGNLITNLAFFLGIAGFYKLIKLDYSEKLAKISVILLLLFPTSYYFASIYTESLFLAFSVWAFYFVRRGNFFAASICGIFLCTTRFVGLIIFPSMLIEWLALNQGKKNIFKTFPWITLVIPAGLLAYMYYLERTVHDAFAFYNNLADFGEQRSSHLVTLPQVFYRYVVRILPSLNTSFFPVIFTTWLEFSVGLVYLAISIFSFFKLRLSYAFFITLGYLIPTFSGSFSSLPRYVLVLFPVYILVAQYFSGRKAFLVAFSLISFILLAISFGLFSRGYWVS